MTLFYSSAVKPAEKATMGLARVGSRAALSFAFAFLRRAWRSGEDADLCSELLQESLDALRSLPEATLFDEGSVSSVWLEVVERATKFLHSVVAGWVDLVLPTFCKDSGEMIFNHCDGKILRVFEFTICSELFWKKNHLLQWRDKSFF